MVKQVFIFGASMAYGVGAESGWGDLLKQYLQGQNQPNVTFEIYNFAKPGATIDFVARTFLAQLDDYKREHDAIAIVQIGANNAKSINTPDNYVSSLDDFGMQYEKLIVGLSNNFSKVIAVGLPPVDESKTTPKTNPFNDDLSYFTNNRMQTFSKLSENICHKNNVEFINISDLSSEWASKCICPDGLHPNQAGYKVIFNKLLPQLDAALGISYS